jgi:hypothetical protein
LDEEIRAVTAQLRSAEYRDALELVSGWAVRPEDLQQLLLQHKPQIVHFSGHGNQIAASDPILTSILEKGHDDTASLVRHVEERPDESANSGGSRTSVIHP